MAKITKTEEQLTKDLEVAMKKLYKTLLGTPKEKIQILRTKFESEIQQLIQPNQTEKVSEKKENPKKKEKSEPSEEMKAILDLLRHLTPHAEIAQRYGRTHSAISQTAKKNGIYSPKAVRRELEKPEVAELPNEELATKMGVYPEDIERIRQELEKGKEQASQEEQEKQHEQEIKLATQQEENTGKVKTRTRISTEDKEKIIELAKQGFYQTTIAGEMQRSQANISRILREEGIMPKTKIAALLKKTESQQMSDEDLAAKTGVYPETIRRIREKLNEEEAPTHTEDPKEVVLPEKQNSQEPEQEPEMESIVQQIVNYGRKGMEISDIVERTGASEEIINNTFKQNHIWSSQKIREKLAQPETKRTPNAVWARWTGVDEETITRIREELERDKKNEEHLSSERIQQQTKPIEENDSLLEDQNSQQAQTRRMLQQIQKYGRQGMEISEIKEKVGLSAGTVGHTLRKHGIWNVAKIRKELKQPGAEKRSNTSWANLTGVDIETIRRIREEIKGEETESREEVQGDVVKSKRPYTPRNSSFRERLSISRSGRVQITQESDDIELEAEEASPVITYKLEAQEYPKNEQELAEELGILASLIRPIKSRLYIYPAVGAIAKEYKVSREVVERILEVIKKEQYDRTHTVVQYKIKMNELRSIVKSEVKDKSKAIALEYQVDILAREFAPFLTQNDYIFLAYGYAKARKYEKAIRFGEEHLGLDTPSIPALEQKIQELLQRGLDDKEKQKVAKTFKIFGGGNEDER